jgi:hypothetical protein
MIANQNKTIRNVTMTKPSLNTVEREFYEERASILEIDGGLSKENAEIEAVKLTLIFFCKTKLF